MNPSGSDSLSPVGLPSFTGNLLNGLSEGIAVLDTNDVITYCNPVFEAITYKQRSDLVGQSITTVFPGLRLPDQLPPGSYGQEVVSSENGTISLRIVPSLDNQGQVTGSLVMLSQVTAVQSQTEAFRPAASDSMFVKADGTEQTSPDSFFPNRESDVSAFSPDSAKQQLMEQKLKENEERLRSLNAELERRVSERTASLAESEERYRMFVQQSSEAIWRFELDGIDYIPTNLPEHEQIELFYRHGYLAECNDTMALMYGYEKAEDITGTRLADLIPIAESANQEYLQKFIRSGYRLANTESVEIDRYGQIKYFMNNLLGIGENGKVYRAWGTQRDITDRKRAEEALREKELEYRSLVTATAQIIWHTDGNGLVTEPQPLWERYTGQDRNDLKGDGWLKSVHPEDYERVASTWQHAIERQQVYEAEFRIRSKTGEYRWFSVRGVPVFSKHGTIRKWLGTCSDVHGRRTAIEALKESEARFRLVARATNEGIWDWDITTDKVWRNENYYTMFGYTAHSLEGTYSDFDVRIHPDDAESVRLSVGEAFHKRQDYWTQEYRIGRADGTYAYILDRAYILYDEKNQPVRMIGSKFDLSPQRATRAALEKQALELQRYNTDLEQFAYISSHDLQEPLNIASSFAKLLKRRYYDQLDQDAHEFIDYIVDSTGMMRQMVRSLLEFSRISSTNKPKENIRLAEVLTAVLQNLQAQITESKAIIEHDPLPPIFANVSQMIQLFGHLLDNALKFRSEKPLYIRISVQEQPDDWLFAISDTGIGMNIEEAKDKIFQVFQRLHPRETYPGTGIGLAICKKIVERHGGTLWAESQPGQGSVFYFTLKKEG